MIKHHVHNLIILDESGSMNEIKPYIMDGFNELVKTIKDIANQFPEQEHYISMVSFNSKEKNVLHFVDDVTQIKEINTNSYNPDALTPLYDAIGFAVLKLKNQIENNKNYHVLVTILTDGEENASVEFSGLEINQLIKKLKLLNWTFTYIGTEHNVERTALNLNIKHSLSFDKNQLGIKKMFYKEKMARIKYSQSIREGKSETSDFYE